MTALTIRELDLFQTETEAQARQVVAAAFGRAVEAGTITRNTWRPQGGIPTRYLGAFQGGEMVGFAAFLGHRFTFEGEPLPAYQRCWSSVAPSARGSGAFTALVEEAKALLRPTARLLIAFPNANAARVTTGRLGFRDWGGFVRCLLPAHPLLARLWTRPPPSGSLGPAVEQDHRELHHLKEAEGRHPAFLHQCPAGNLYWGIIRRSPRLGGRLRVASVGGVHLEDPASFSSGVSSLVRTLRVGAVEFSAHRSSPLALLLRRVRPVPDSPPLATFPLHPLPEISQWNLSLGVLDAF